MKLIFIVEYLSVVKLWIDASRNTHDYCRVHTSIIMTLGRGGILILSLKQKFNVKSYT